MKMPIMSDAEFTRFLNKMADEVKKPISRKKPKKTRRQPTLILDALNEIQSR